MTRLITLLCCLAAAGCSKTSPPSPPVVTPPAGNETINGTERIGWDQRAADEAELATIGYVLYVDGARTALTGTTCATTASALGFACSARLPALTAGAHALQLAAFVDQGGVLESERSATLQVTVVASVTRQPTDVAQARITTADGVALRSDLVADGLDQPTDLAFAPDGRIFIAERAGRIRIIRDDRLLPEPALSLAETTGPDTILLALALDPDFARTHFVFAIYAAPSRAGELEFTLARFRDASDTLADRIILLDGVRASASPAAALRVGADNKLYVAFDDGGDARRSGDPASPNGKILRLNLDGTTPADQPGLSPVYAEGVRSPRGFDWDQKSGRPAAALPVSAAPYRGRLFPSFTGRLLIASKEGRLVSRTSADRLEEFQPDRIAGVLVVAVSPDGAIYFATGTALGRLVPDAGP